MDPEVFSTKFAHIQLSDSNGNPTPYFITVDIVNKPDAPSYEWLADNIICIYRNHLRVEFHIVSTIIKSLDKDYINKIYLQCFPTTKSKNKI